MRGLSDTAVVELWEQGRSRHPLDRAVLLCSAATTSEAPADLPLGCRDAAILALRNASFGPRIDAYGNCPACGDRFECAFDGTDLLAAAPAPQEMVFTDAQGRRLRLPTSRDLAESRDSTELAQRCVMEGVFSDADDIAALLSDRDPAAEMDLAMRCRSCDHHWEVVFDPPRYLWEEIEDRANRLLDEVHVLASAYGWTEAQVLGLGASRRAAYLDRCGA